MFTPVAASSRVGGFARAIFTTFAIVLFGASLSLNGYLLVLQGLLGGEQSQFEQSVLTDGDMKTQIAVVKIDGMIVEEEAERFSKLLDEVESNQNVRALVVQVNTPGGTVTASDAIHARLLRWKQERGTPVYLSMGEMATSGGYYIACAADRVYAHRTTWTGNIGVLLPRLSLAKLGDKYGIEDQTIASTGADFKDAGSMWKNDTPEETAYWQGLADEAFVLFKQVIVDGRRLDPAVVDSIANGKVYSGDQAKKLKLIDDVGTVDDAIAAAANQVNVTRPHVVRYERTTGFLEALGGQTSQPKRVSTSVGGMDISVDQSLLESWFAHKPMYLWRAH
jgi:protease-4